MISTLYLFENIINSTGRTIGRGVNIGVRHFKKNAPHYKYAAGKTLQATGKLTKMTGNQLIKTGDNLVYKK